MEKQTVFIKRYPSKGEFPKRDGVYWCKFKDFSDALHQQEWVLEFGGFGDNEAYDYWLEEIELPSEEDMEDHLLNHRVESRVSVKRGMNFILNILKGETK